MKTLENETEKVNRICEMLRKEALEPAERQAITILEEAKRQADERILLAEKEASEIIKNAQSTVEREKKVFESSLAQGAKLALESLRQEIQNHLFNPALDHLIEKNTVKPEVIAAIIDALTHAVKQGATGDLIGYIPSQVKPEQVNALLLKEVIEQLKEHSVSLGKFNGGAQLKLVDQNIVLDMSVQAIKELIATFIRPDFRKYIFNV